MNAILIYLLMTIVPLGIVYAGYVLVLRSETFYRFNRIYLLSGLLASLLLPVAAWMRWLPDLTTWIPELTFNWMPAQGQTTEPVYLGTINAPGFVLTLMPENGTTLWKVLLYGYLFVSLFMLVRFVVRLYGVLSLRFKAENQKYPGYSVCWVAGDLSPFSFFQTVFLPKALWGDDCTTGILRHEEIHIREGHSFDILLLQWLRVFFWFNPFLYMIDKALREAHEFQADARVLKEGLGLESYQTLLLRHLGGAQALALSNNFNYSLIKRRLTMFTRKSNRWARYRSVVMLPLAMGMMCFYTSGCGSREQTAVGMTGDSTQVLTAKDTLAVGADTIGKADPDAPLLWVEEQPEFPGGVKKMYDFLKKNLNYPEGSWDKGVQGTVVLFFVVATDGSLSQITVARSLDPECDAEAIRVIKLMPKWTPGKQDGKVVPVRFTLPIKFTIGR